MDALFPVVVPRYAHVKVLVSEGDFVGLGRVSEGSISALRLGHSGRVVSRA